METRKVSMDVLVQFAVKLTGAVAEVEKAGPDNYSKLLLKTIPGLVSEAFSELSQIKKELAGMDEVKKAAFTSEVTANVLQAVQNKKLAELVSNIVSRLVMTAEDPEDEGVLDAERVLDITLFIFGIMSLVPDYLINLLYSQSRNERNDITMVDPKQEFWFQRVDGIGSKLLFSNDGLYLVNFIPIIASSTTHYDAEIYNSPYTVLHPKNVIINTFPVDPPLKEQNKFVYDFFLNVPYAPSNGIVFSATIKAENLNGGSRGWGFWNTSLGVGTLLGYGMSLASLGLGDNFAWFIQCEGYKPNGDPYPWNGFWAQTRNASGKVWPPCSCIRLPDLDEEWHDYRIEINKDSVEYFIDEKSVAKVTNPECLPNTPLAFHNWVDNALYLGDPPYIALQTSTAPRINRTQSMTIKYGK